MEKIYTSGKPFTFLFLCLSFIFTTKTNAQEVQAWGYVCGGVGNPTGYEFGNFYTYDIATGEPTEVAQASDCGGPNLFITGEIVDGRYYTIDNTTRELYAFDEESNCEFIATINPPGPSFVIALSHDPSTSTTYYVAGNSLYTIDLATGATTLITNSLPGTPISLPIDGQGNAFLISLAGNTITPIDLSTGTASGPAVNLSVNINFAQDMDFDCDDTTNTLYGIVYSGGGDARYGTIDPTTGVFDEIRFLGSETCGFSIGVMGEEAAPLPLMSTYRGWLMGSLILGVAVFFFIGRVQF